MVGAAASEAGAWGAQVAAQLALGRGTAAVVWLAEPVAAFLAAFPVWRGAGGGDALPRPRSTLPNAVCVPWLFLGDVVHATCLAPARVTHVVDISLDARARERFAAAGVSYLTLELHDVAQSNIRQHFDAVYDFVVAAHRDPAARVLVHCQAGVSRSATLVVRVVCGGVLVVVLLLL